MRIAVWHNLPSGGGSRALVYHLSGLLQRGHHLDIWSNQHAHELPLGPYGNAVRYHQIPLSQAPQQVPWTDRLRSFFFEKDQAMRHMEAHCQACAEQINAGGFDVCFVNSCQQYAVPFLGRYLQIPAVLYLGEPYRPLYEAMPVLPWAALESFWAKGRHLYYQKRFWKDLWYERKLRVQVREEAHNAAAYTKVLVNSYFSNETFVKVYGWAAEVCYLGIDTQLFKNQTSVERKHVLGVGSFYRHKNPEFAIRALAQIPTSLRPKLVWVSNSAAESYVTEMQTLALQLGVGFELHQKVSDARLVELMNGAICMAYTSNLEPFGLAPLEAAACGVPVVAVAEGGLRETVLDGQTGFLCPRRAEVFASKIQLLLEDLALRERMGAAAIAHVQAHWTLAAADQRIEQALMAVMRKSGV